MSVLKLYHGSPEIVEVPEYGKGKLYNDYGRGFYCTSDLELAREWACGQHGDGYVNLYSIRTTGLNILNLSSEKHTILHWLTLLMKYRDISISTPLMRRGREWLLEHFLLDIDGYDAIIGYRADDSYFSFARAFVNNEISLLQLSYAMKLGNLGKQFVLKSSNAFASIRFIDSEKVSSPVYFKKRRQRDAEAKAAFRKELEREDVNGLFIRDLMKEGIQADDPRLL